VGTLVSPVGAGFSAPLPERVAPEYPTGPSAAERTRALVLSTLKSRALRRHLDQADVVHYPFTVPVPRAWPHQRLP
jgi:hypothetical protein